MSKDNLHVLRQAVAKGLVQEKQKDGLSLFQYTRNCMFRPRNWSRTTKKARGIILDTSGRVVCRPFNKFFNLDEVPSTSSKVVYHKLSKQAVEITEKLDGSMISLWHYNGEWRTSTTGSFHSSQALYALEMLHKKYPKFVQLDHAYTYIFELVGVEWDRKVVKYDEEALVLLTALRNTWWEEEEVDRDVLDAMVKGMGFGRPKVITLNPYAAIHGSDIGDNEEGYVFRFSDGLRLKIKSVRYVRLHRLLSGLNPRKLIDVMKSGDYDEVMWDVPKHIRDDFDDLLASLMQIHAQIASEAEEYWLDMENNVGRNAGFKEMAIYIQQNVPIEMRSLLYNRMRNKERSSIVWDLVLERAKNIAV
jgi:RNA ligase